MMEPLKEAFSKIKKDIDSLNYEMKYLKDELIQTREELIKICEIMMCLDKKVNESSEKKKENQHEDTEKHNPTHLQIDQALPTHNPTHLMPLEVLKDQNKPFSSGNEGVPTDRQTDQQTDTKRKNSLISNQKFTSKIEEVPLKSIPITTKIEKNSDFDYFIENSTNPIDNAAKILDSLDSIKKEIRLKFKRLTPQEMTVFSTIYQMEEETEQVDYKILAKKLSLTESSVRDYIGRLIKKGIPVEKKRINNKTILLSVSSNLKKITSLSTIIQLRDL